MDLSAIMEGHPGKNPATDKLPHIPEVDSALDGMKADVVMPRTSDGQISDLKMANIAVYGSLNMDIFSYVARAPRAGETVQGLDSYTAPGGKGANQAAACAKLSRLEPGSEQSKTWDRPLMASTRMFGAVGNDEFGRTLTQALVGIGVDCGSVATKQDVGTGTAIIVVEPNGENRIIVNANANFSVMPEDFPWLPLPKPDVIILQLEIPTATVVHLIRLAKANNVAVILNPSPVKTLPDDIYDGLDHLLINETECRTLLGHANPERKLEVEEVREAAVMFNNKGVKNVVITLGSRGAFARSISGEQGFVAAELVEEVVDTTGAGDTFTGAYALGVVLNKEPGCFDLVAAVGDGCHAAAHAVTKRGAIPAIPFLSNLSDPHMRFDHRAREAHKTGRVGSSTGPSVLEGDLGGKDAEVGSSGASMDIELGQKRESDDKADSPSPKRQRGDEPMEQS
jgi:ribokinase